MRSISFVFALALLVQPAAAQPTTAQSISNLALPPATLDRQMAPWWLLEPVSASLGVAERIVPSNRANLSASYQGLGKTPADASSAAQNSAAPLADALRTLGADKVRIETSLSVEPIYQRYKDKSGQMIDNRRADKIESYSANITLKLEVRDLSVYRQTLMAVVASEPFNIGSTSFGLEPGNELLTSLFREAAADAASRAHTGAEAAGAKLGPVKVIDVTARACQSGSLLSPGYQASVGSGDVVVTGTYLRGSAESAAMPVSVADFVRSTPKPTKPVAQDLINAMAEITASNEALSRNSAFALPFTPPRQKLVTQACVIYLLE